MNGASVGTCYKCGRERDLTTRYCTYCDADLGPSGTNEASEPHLRTQPCPNPACDNRLTVVATDCPKCGHKLASPARSRLAQRDEERRAAEKEGPLTGFPVAFGVIGFLIGLPYAIEENTYWMPGVVGFVGYLFARVVTSGIHRRVWDELDSGSAAPNHRRGLPSSTRFAVLVRDDYTCAYCGRKPPEVTLHVDHRLPVSMGGSNDLSNLVTSCSECNLGKSNRYVT